MDRIAELRDAGELQARLCQDNGSPTYAALIGELTRRLGRPDPVTELLRSDTREPTGSALHLRFLGAVNRLALADRQCPLRAFYPTLGGTADPAGVLPVFFEVAEQNLDRLARDMRADVQTNDVGRAAPLSAGMNHVQNVSGGPLRLLEVGASAGLNLGLDHYRVETETSAWGPVDSPVQLTGRFVSGDPPGGGFVVSARRGCDLTPVDLTDPWARTVLRSFVWPEHVERLRQLDKAMEIASPVRLDAGDACTWLRSRLAEHAESRPADGTTVVFHSIVWPYLTEVERRTFEHLMLSAGEKADAGHRLAWLSMEPTPDYGRVELHCRHWPGGERLRLATSTAHGALITWDPVPLPSP